MSKKKNKFNNHIIQVLLDIMQFGHKDERVGELVNTLQSDVFHLKEITNYNNLHRYASTGFTFAQVNNLNSSWAILHLAKQKNGGIATQLLMLYMVNMTPNYCFSAGVDVLSALFGVDEKTIRRGLKVLVDNGFIAVLVKGGKQGPTIHMVNPKLATVGRPAKPNDHVAFAQLAGKVAYDKFDLLDKANSNFAFSNIKTSKDGKDFRYNQMIMNKPKDEPVQPKNKAKNPKDMNNLNKKNDNISPQSDAAIDKGSIDNHPQLNEFNANSITEPELFSKDEKKLFEGAI